MIFIAIEIFIKEVVFIIYKVESDEKKYITQNKIVIPQALDIGERLNYIRKLMSTIVKLYSVTNAYIETDDSAEKGIVEMLKVEGLLEELLSSCGVEIWK